MLWRDKLLFQSMRWGVVGTLSTQGANLLRIFLVSFIVGPTALGDYVLAATVFTAISIVIELGLKQLYVGGQFDYMEITNEKILSTVWLLIILTRLFILLLLGIVYLIVGAFGESFIWLNMAMFLSIIICLQAIANPQLLVYEKLGDFKYQSICELTSHTVAIIFLLIYLNYYESVWGLIYSQAIASMFFIILSYILKPYVKIAYFDFTVVNFAFRQGLNFVKISAATFITYGLDKVIISALLSKEILSIYFLAQKISEIPSQFLTLVVNRALLPYFSKMYKEDKIDKLLIVLKSRFFQLFLSFVVIAFFAYILSFFIDENEYEMVLKILPGLLIGVVFRAMTQMIGSLYIVMGNINIDAYYKIQEAVLYIVLMPLMTWLLGISGIIIAFILIYAFSFYRRYIYLRE